jgi:hypothetical protein
MQAMQAQFETQLQEVHAELLRRTATQSSSEQDATDPIYSTCSLLYSMPYYTLL